MKRFFLICLLCAGVNPSLWGQSSGNVTMVLFPSAPTGLCNSRQVALNQGNGSLYTCHNSQWFLVSGGGGGGGWNPPQVPGDTIFGNNTVATNYPSFFIPGGDVSYSAGNFSVNFLHFGPVMMQLLNSGIVTGNCLQVSANSIIGGSCGTGGGGGNVASVFGRTGAIVAQTNDYSVGQVAGAAGLASPAFTGVPTAPTAPLGTNTTQLATTAFVLANGGSGGGLLGGSGTVNTIPKFTATTTVGNSLLTDSGTTLNYGGMGGISAQKFNVPVGGLEFVSVTAPLPALPGAGQNALVSGPDGWYFSNDNSAYQKIGTGGGGGTGAVSSVFGRSGAVTAVAGDYTYSQVTGAAPLASPTFTGTPAAPTATAGTNTTQLATTAFVLANRGVNTIFGRTGTVTAASGDYSVAQVTGAAPTASPAFTGTPTAPTAPVGTSTTQLATTAFVMQNQGGGTGGTITKINGGTITVGDGVVQVGADSCNNLTATPSTSTAPGVQQTDVVLWTAEAQPTGWGNGKVILRALAYQGAISWRACNVGTTVQTPQGMVVHWMVLR